MTCWLAHECLTSSGYELTRAGCVFDNGRLGVLKGVRVCLRGYRKAQVEHEIPEARGYEFESPGVRVYGKCL